MSFLKFNKAELVNLSYSLKREILLANKSGAVCNTSTVTCNTRRYHGLLSVTLDRFGGDKYLLLSSLDETLDLSGKRFNLGIHCYGDVYDPRGHKYIVDFEADPAPKITYKVGDLVFTKTLLLNQDRDQVLIRYSLVEGPASVKLLLKPFLAFRNVHDLTHRNDAAMTAPREVPGGVSFKLYPGFPDLFLQLNTRSAVFESSPSWYEGITYSDEYRRGFDCREDLFVPGNLVLTLKKGEDVVFSASIAEANPAQLKRTFNAVYAAMPAITNFHDQLVRCANLLIVNHNNRKRINAGFSWLKTGLLRETLLALPGLTLCAGRPEEFEEILDNLIADEQERLFRRTTQVEAPLYLPVILQKYIKFGASPEKVWKKYGVIVRGIIESYAPGERQEVSLQPNGLLWAQMNGVALSWMNAYAYGSPVTERAGFQVETNAFWYNALCFAIDMETRFGSAGGSFVARWTPVRDQVLESFIPTFWNPETGCLADVVDAAGRNPDIRPNQIYALALEYSPVPDELIPPILRVFDAELVTRRGIRTLSPRDVKYRGVYVGTQIDRDLAYQQGSCWPFLLAPYVEVCLKVKGEAFVKKAEWLIEGFFEDLGKHGVGAFSELYDGDPPHEPHGAISSATSTAALLSVEYFINRFKKEGKL
ncbi:MAG: glycogen debranching enzyme N-terminal domain-containing protein [Bacteroidales bacterium]|nr:glycogen debranching enzyme N-terminal domain-containing protein [Bacteroidales bacterium]